MNLRISDLMVAISLVVNVAVLVPVCLGLVLDSGWTGSAYGGTTPARGILLSIYLAICILSLVLLIRRDFTMAAPLLLVQVIYKVTTPITVGTLDNPVVISNLAIALLHTVTLVVVYRAGTGAATT